MAIEGKIQATLCNKYGGHIPLSVTTTINSQQKSIFPLLTPLAAAEATPIYTSAPYPRRPLEELVFLDLP
jgi:hypothetical protein